MIAEQLKTGITRAIWEVDVASLPGWKARCIGGLRVVYVVVRDLSEGQLTLRAMSLVYTTLLALVPLLAVSFSILKSFGVHNQIEPVLLRFLAPLGEKGIEISSRVIGFVDNVKAGVLGSVGLALLIYTVISLIQKIERAFNYTWHVKQSRPFAQRFSDYLSVTLIGPVLLFSALGITASVMSTAVVQKLVAIEPFGSLLTMASKLLPYFLTITAFTFVYIFVPNTKVRFRSALIGAVIAGSLWQLTGWAFASFIVTSTRYTAIYSSFAILIMFMIWLYLSWLILLVGASISFYHQHPESLSLHWHELKLGSRLKEEVTLLAMFLIGQSYYERRPAWTLEDLARRLGIPGETLESTLEALERSGIITQTGQDPPGYLPALPPDDTNLKEVLDAVRGMPQHSSISMEERAISPAVAELVDQLDQAIAEALRGRTLKNLVLSDQPPRASVSRPLGEQAATSQNSRKV
ncbi:MAG: YhjD/YihY/BrkB family envelope integrity protein [Syntrophobacteria bacterium]